MSSNNVLHACHIIKPPLLIFWHHSATGSCKSASHKVSNNNLAFMITNIFLSQLVTQKLAKQKKRKQVLIIIDSISSLESRIPFSYPFCFHLLFQCYHIIIAWHIWNFKKKPRFPRSTLDLRKQGLHLILVTSGVGRFHGLIRWWLSDAVAETTKTSERF